MHWTLLFSSFPCPSVSAAHHASHCPPNAPLSLPQSTLGRGWRAKTKGRTAGLALGILALYPQKGRGAAEFYDCQESTLLLTNGSCVMLKCGPGQKLRRSSFQHDRTLNISLRQEPVPEALFGLLPLC